MRRTKALTSEEDLCIVCCGECGYEASVARSLPTHQPHARARSSVSREHVTRAHVYPRLCSVHLGKPCVHLIG